MNTLPFTTYDRDNDASSDNCANIYKGGWWFNKCEFVYLNGPRESSHKFAVYGGTIRDMNNFNSSMLMITRM